MLSQLSASVETTLLSSLRLSAAHFLVWRAYDLRGNLKIEIYTRTLVTGNAIGVAKVGRKGTVGDLAVSRSLLNVSHLSAVRFQQ